MGARRLKASYLGHHKPADRGRLDAVDPDAPAKAVRCDRLDQTMERLDKAMDVKLTADGSRWG